MSDLDGESMLAVWSVVFSPDLRRVVVNAEPHATFMFGSLQEDWKRGLRLISQGQRWLVSQPTETVWLPGLWEWTQSKSGIRKHGDT